MTETLFIYVLLVGMVCATIAQTVDRIADKPCSPDREQRAQVWDDKADELLEEALTDEARGLTFLARDGRRSARRARKHAKKIRRGKV